MGHDCLVGGHGRVQIMKRILHVINEKSDHKLL